MDQEAVRVGLIGLAAVQVGLAVVVDKPLALTAAEGRRLVTAARERGVLLTVFHNRRWDGDLRTLQRLLDDAETRRHPVERGPVSGVHAGHVGSRVRPDPQNVIW